MTKPLPAVLQNRIGHNLFILTAKVNKGRGRWIAIAGTDCKAATCIAAAEDVFRACGYDVRGVNQVQWVTVLKQKNFLGYADDFKMVECTPDEARCFWFKEIASRPYYKDLNDFIETYPGADKFRADLEPIFQAK